MPDTPVDRDPAVFELNGRQAVKCADCQTVYSAIGAQCPECGSEEVLRPRNDK